MTVENPTCSRLPPLTASEIEFGTAQEAINWTCDDANNPGSICQKTCAANHMHQHAGRGNPRMICVCVGNDCEWEITQENSKPDVYGEDISSTISLGCLPGCDVNPTRLTADRWLTSFGTEPIEGQLFHYYTSTTHHTSLLSLLLPPRVPHTTHESPHLSLSFPPPLGVRSF